MVTGNMCTKFELHATSILELGAVIGQTDIWRDRRTDEQTDTKA